MSRIVDWVRTVSLAFGAPGLFVSAFLDSSFLSLPEVNDLLLVWMTTQHEGRMPIYAASATAGSLAGCLVLYYIGKKGTSVTERFGAARVERTLRAFRRFGVLAVLVPSLLPPPAPFKIFVLLAGVAEISVSRFTLALVLGRGLRYFGLGFLAVWYGDRAIDYLHTHGSSMSLVVVIVLVAGLVGYVLWTKATGRNRG